MREPCAVFTRYDVPPAAWNVHLAKVRESVALLERQPGYVDHLILQEQGKGEGMGLITLAIWRDDAALAAARQAMQVQQQQQGFDRQAYLQAAGITVETGAFAVV